MAMCYVLCVVCCGLRKCGIGTLNQLTRRVSEPTIALLLLPFLFCLLLLLLLLDGYVARCATS
jgi:hypothetical protein